MLNEDRRPTISINISAEKEDVQMKKGLILGLIAGAAAATAAAIIYKKKQEEYCNYDDDIDAEFECDSCCCDDCCDDCYDDIPEEKAADSSIVTDNCTASSAGSTADEGHDTEINSN